MTTLTLIQCTATKRDGTHAAKQLYDESTYFRKMRAWAESRDCEYAILSAKHGLVDPDERLTDYDERGVSSNLAKQIAGKLSNRGVDTIHICAGRDYTDALIPECEAVGIDCINHFAGKGIGKRMQLLKQRTDNP